MAWHSSTIDWWFGSVHWNIKRAMNQIINVIMGFLIWLVVWHMTFIFHNILCGIILPIDFHIFSRWLKHVKTTNQSLFQAATANYHLALGMCRKRGCQGEVAETLRDIGPLAVQKHPNTGRGGHV